MYANINAAVIGGGLVGALEACMLARQGFKVTIFEGRHDGRDEPSYYGRSINLAISHRGISALKRVGLDHIVERLSIPMRARMIHGLTGKQNPIPYDPHGKCIYSIQRSTLNNFLLNEAERQFGVKILFEHRLVDMDPKTGELYFRTKPSEKAAGDELEKLMSYKSDIILGCDGARSTVRNLLSRQSIMDTSQTFIEHAYLELTIQPNPDGSYKMQPNFLHIWPRGEFMMIALPNSDHSFTCTLFVPNEVVETLKTPGQASLFFKKYFPDAVSLIGEMSIIETIATTRASPLISIKCDPYHYSSTVALLGDAAHAMVPFYGQGMNCGFEDCLVLDDLITNFAKIPSQSIRFEVIFEEYSRKRVPNGKSMSDLAMYNYIEMRDLVNTWTFKLRKSFDNTMYRFCPSGWIPLYTMVTFTQIPIDECTRRRKNQDKVIRYAFFIALGIIALTALICI